jgi:hypothetical protein
VFRFMSAELEIALPGIERLAKGGQSVASAAQPRRSQVKRPLIVAGCIVLLAVCVIVIGSLLPKAHSGSRAAVYNATPDRLFALIAGRQNWRPHVLSYRGSGANASRCRCVAS